MSPIDWIVLALYMIGLIAIGAIFSRITSARAMFAAGGQSPWWISGLSAFMTFFSAGTFVVWGGIAYSYGLVGICIQLCIGVAAFIAGRLIAGRWHQLGVVNASDYIKLRFGPSMVRFYIWISTLRAPFNLGVSVYAFCLIACPLIPLEEGNMFRDPNTGTLSVTWAIVGFMIMVTLYTMIGGLWAVLVTDVLQFIVLMAAVIIVVPLWVIRLLSIDQPIGPLPDGFLMPTGGSYGWWFLALFTICNSISMGMEWHFAQRALCVPTAKDARKAFYLFGFLYLISPIIWMLPPIFYRLENPGANPDEAYILACQAVLPVGLLGLLLAAMFSATASTVSSILNVLSGSVLSDLQSYFKKLGDDGRAVIAGRTITCLFGAATIGGAFIIQYAGSVTGFVLGMNIFAGAMLVPALWGFFSKKLPSWSLWIVVGVQLLIAAFFKFYLVRSVFMDGWLNDFSEYYRLNERTLDMVIGFGTPFIILTVVQLCSSKTAEGWTRIREQINKTRVVLPIESSRKPLWVIAGSVASIGVLTLFVTFIVSEDRLILGIFSALMFILAGGVLANLRKSAAQRAK